MKESEEWITKKGGNSAGKVAKHSAQENSIQKELEQQFSLTIFWNVGRLLKQSWKEKLHDHEIVRWKF